MSDVWRWGTGADEYSLLDERGNRLLELEATSPNDPELFALIADVPAMLELLREFAGTRCGPGCIDVLFKQGSCPHERARALLAKHETP